MKKTEKHVFSNSLNPKSGAFSGEKIFGFSDDKFATTSVDPFENDIELLLERDAAVEENIIERVKSYGRTKSFFDAESLSELYYKDQDFEADRKNYIEDNIGYIEKGQVVVSVMDKHNFYETEQLTDDDLKKSNVGLLTKLWIYISRAVEE